MTVVTADVVVIGAGVAGLSAAVRLADAGKRVVVVESAPRLGGRASTFADPATGERVDNGQHVLFGCYRETYAFLKLIGTDSLAPRDGRLRLTMIGPDGRSHVLSCPALPAPWHLVAGILKWDAVPLRDRLSALRLARTLGETRSEGDGSRLREQDPSPSGLVSVPVDDWLRGHGQSPALCHWLWHPLALAALNQSPAIATAPTFVNVLRQLLGRRADDSAIGLPIAPLDELFGISAARFVEARGGQVLLKSPGRVVLDDAGRIAGVRSGATSIQAPAVISAVPWHRLAGIWDEGCPPALSASCIDAARMTSSSIVTVNVWFDAPIMTERFVGLAGAQMHWVFDKSALFGGKAGHLSIVSSGADDLADMDNDAVTNIAIRDLTRALPAVSARRLLRSVVVREHHATFSLAAGEPPRPSTRTALPGFLLAGDWIDTGLPATIEGAVTSGRTAAEEVLHFLHSLHSLQGCDSTVATCDDRPR